MQFIINIWKRFISWVTSLFAGGAKVDPQLAADLQEELLNIKNFVQNLSQDVNAYHPLLKTIIVSKVNLNLFKNNQAKISALKSPIKETIEECDKQIQICADSCTHHNEVFEKFVQIYIRNGLSLTGISHFDPQKMTAYKDVHSQYTLLMQSAKSLKDNCASTLNAIDNTLKLLD
jgi:hypothetical protein